MKLDEIMKQLLKSDPKLITGGLFILFGALFSVLIWPIGGMFVLIGLALLIINLLRGSGK